MNERQLADLLRHIDDESPLDADALDFKARLRVDLDDTLAHLEGRPGMYFARHGESTRRRAGTFAFVAAFAVLVVGAFVVLASRSADVPEGPATMPVTTAPRTPATSLPVLDPTSACARFRSFPASELLFGVVPDDVSAVDVAALVTALDTLSADVFAAPSGDASAPVVDRVQDAAREAVLRLEDGDRAGALAALQVARTESAAPTADSAFGACWER